MASLRRYAGLRLVHRRINQEHDRSLAGRVETRHPQSQPLQDFAKRQILATMGSATGRGVYGCYGMERARPIETAMTVAATRTTARRLGRFFMVPLLSRRRRRTGRAG